MHKCSKALLHLNNNLAFTCHPCFCVPELMEAENLPPSSSRQGRLAVSYIVKRSETLLTEAHFVTLLDAISRKTIKGTPD